MILKQLKFKVSDSETGEVAESDSIEAIRNTVQGWISSGFKKENIKVEGCQPEAVWENQEPIILDPKFDEYLKLIQDKEIFFIAKNRSRVNVSEIVLYILCEALERKKSMMARMKYGGYYDSLETEVELLEKILENTSFDL